MHPILRKIIFALSAFVIFMIIAVSLKLFSGNKYDDTLILGFFTDTDLLLGLAVAALVTFNRERKKKL